MPMFICRNGVNLFCSKSEFILQQMPYGKWTCADGREVLFDRNYTPMNERRPDEDAGQSRGYRMGRMGKATRLLPPILIASAILSPTRPASLPISNFSKQNYSINYRRPRLTFSYRANSFSGTLLTRT